MRFIRLLLMVGVLSTLPILAAFASSGNMGTGTSKTDGVTVAISSTAQTANVGDLVVILISADNVDTTDVETTHWSVADSTGSNTYTRIGEFVNGEGAAAAGVQVALFYSRLTAELAATSTITATTDSTIIAKAIRGWRFTTGASIAVAASATPANWDQASPGDMTLSGLASKEYLFFRAVAVESDNSVGGGAATSGWTGIPRSGTSGGNEQSNVSTAGEFRVLTGTGETSSFAFSGGTQRDNSNWFAAFEEAAGGTSIKDVIQRGVGVRPR